MRANSVVVRGERSFDRAGIGGSVSIPDVPNVRTVRLVRVADAQGFGNPQQDRQSTRDVSIMRLALHSVSVFVWILASGLGALAILPAVLGYAPVIVSTGSMSPSINRGDVVVTKPSDGTNLAVGAVIDHVVDGTKRIHRVVAVVPDGYRTKGDANEAIDTSIVRPESITGVGALVVPGVGLPGLWLESRSWIELALLSALLIASGYMARSSWVFGPSRPSIRHGFGVTA
jgi:signal peptidase